MAYVIDIPASLLALMEELPPRTCASVQCVLERLMEQADFWSPDDPRWEQLAHAEGDGWRFHFYVDGCCVRVELLPEVRCLRVREIGRVLVHLPADGAGFGVNP